MGCGEGGRLGWFPDVIFPVMNLAVRLMSALRENMNSDLSWNNLNYKEKHYGNCKRFIICWNWKSFIRNTRESRKENDRTNYKSLSFVFYIFYWLKQPANHRMHIKWKCNCIWRGFNVNILIGWVRCLITERTWDWAGNFVNNAKIILQGKTNKTLSPSWGHAPQCRQETRREKCENVWKVAARANVFNNAGKFAQAAPRTHTEAAT